MKISIMAATPTSQALQARSRSSFRETGSLWQENIGQGRTHLVQHLGGPQVQVAHERHQGAHLRWDQSLMEVLLGGRDDSVEMVSQDILKDDWVKEWSTEDFLLIQLYLVVLTRSSRDI